MSVSNYVVHIRCAVSVAAFVLTASVSFAQDGQTPQAGIETLRVFTGITHVFKQVLTEDNAVVLAPGPIAADGFSAYVDLPGAGPGTGAFGAVVGAGSLISVRFSAESQCAGGGGDFDWCGVRILINGTEAQPAPADFAFDSANNGGEDNGSWEGHSMDRHLCVRNPGTTPILIPVQVQWRVFAGVGGVPPEFRLDDWSLVIETMTATCQ